MSTTIKAAAIVLCVIALAFAYFAYMLPHISFGASAPLDENRNPRVFGSSCAVSSIAAVPVGASNSLQILAASSSRAWARIEQPLNASNTVSIALGQTAVVGSGLQLTMSTSTNPVTFMDVGLDTHAPFTGAVNGITSAGSTTVLVTECGY